MPEIDMTKVREYVREYVTNSSDLKTVSMKPLRRYIEKKLGLPKRSLAIQKPVLKDIISEEVSAVAKERGAAEAKKASIESDKGHVEVKKETDEVEKDAVKSPTKKTEKGTEKGKKKNDKKTETKVEKKSEGDSKVSMENEDVTEDDDVEPKKPLTSYMLFCREKRSSVMSQFPEYGAKEIVAKLGELWNASSDKEKAKYVALAQENRVQYAKQMKEWREQHPESSVKVERKQRKHRTIPNEFIVEKTNELPELSGRRLAKEIKVLWKKLDKKEQQKYLDMEPKVSTRKMKRALSPYNFFCRLYRAEIVKQNPDANPKEVIGLLAKAWQSVDRDVLRQCQKLSEEDKKKKVSELVEGPVEEPIEEPVEEPVEEKKEKKEKKEMRERHVSGYNVYCKEKYAELKTRNVSSKDLLKDIAKQWKDLDENDKKEYIERAEKVTIGPKRVIPSSAFSLYTKESRKQLLKQHQGISREEANNLLKEMWKKLDTEEKIEYENRLHEMRVQRIREEDSALYQCFLIINFMSIRLRAGFTNKEQNNKKEFTFVNTVDEASTCGCYKRSFQLPIQGRPSSPLPRSSSSSPQPYNN